MYLLISDNSYDIESLLHICGKTFRNKVPDVGVNCVSRLSKKRNAELLYAEPKERSRRARRKGKNLSGFLIILSNVCWHVCMCRRRH